MEYQAGRNKKLELRIGFKYDSDAFRLLSKKSSLKVPMLPKMEEQGKLEINETFKLIVKSREKRRSSSSRKSYSKGRKDKKSHH
mmetsp:Transcript_39510/g.29184  ORF Transcript_39510/g.29184 Transcript_39510/m.29184 type:complete len:84 (+) Transcript_39510:483-734(+)